MDLSFFHRIAKIYFRSIVNRDDSSRELFERLGRHVCVRGRKRSRYRSSSGTRCDSQTCFPSITSRTFYLPILVTALAEQKNDSRYRFPVIILRFIVSILHEICKRKQIFPFLMIFSRILAIEKERFLSVRNK